MAALTPTSIYGRVVFLGVNPDRDGTLETQSREELHAEFEGFPGEAHGGLTRASCSRVMGQYPKGTQIRNARQVSILSAGELSEIAAAMGLARLAPEWIGANIVFEGIPLLTQLPSGSRIIFESGAAIVADLENGPCRFAGEAIAANIPGATAQTQFDFVKAAQGKRGMVGYVERPGRVALGMRARLHIPAQRIYAPAMKS